MSIYFIVCSSHTIYTSSSIYRNEEKANFGIKKNNNKYKHVMIPLASKANNYWADVLHTITLPGHRDESVMLRDL